METLTSMPTLPFDLVIDIFGRLPVKLLLQLRCLSKSFNSLISDSKFEKEHLQLQLSIKRHHLVVCSRNNLGELLLFDSPMSSVLSTSTVTQTQLRYPINRKNVGYGGYSRPRGISSCNGILCFSMGPHSAALWNPSIRKFKLLPPLESPQTRFLFSIFSFGYDHFINNYKTIGVLRCINRKIVYINIMGSDCWRRIQDFPSSGQNILGLGVFVSATVNWLTADATSGSLDSIVSLDLEKESYKKHSVPHFKNDKCTLGMMRDCLCIFANNGKFLNVWIMTESGNKESWTKLCNVPYMKDHVLCSYVETLALYIQEGDQLLMKFYDLKSKKLKLIIYDLKNGTLKIPDIQNINHLMDSIVYIESLISPCL